MSAEFYLDIVDSAAAGDTTRFIARRWNLAHYLGDACQPLHVSYLHHGEPGAAKVLCTRFRDILLGKFRKNVVADLQAKADHIVVGELFHGGQRAAEYVMNLMKTR